MDIICLFNGLGNQMSQFAFYLAKAHKHKRVYYLNLADGHFSPHNGFELDRVFGIPAEHNLPLLSKIISRNRWNNPKKYSAFRFITKFITRVIIERKDYRFEPEKLNPHHGINYYIGGWHSDLYFNEIAETLRSVYFFDITKIGRKNTEILDKIKDSESVSIHLRRGDYVGSIYDGICTREYYQNAIAKIKNTLSKKDLTFFVFSDNIEFAKSFFVGDDFQYIDWNNEADSWMDMCLMSKCKHNIIANSTFSWWAAWLNDNPYKVVIAPQFFIAGRETPDFYPADWMKISSAASTDNLSG